MPVKEIDIYLSVKAQFVDKNVKPEDIGKNVYFSYEEVIKLVQKVIDSYGSKK